MSDVHAKLQQIRLTDSPCTLMRIFVSDAPGLFPRENGTKITFDPAVEIQKGDSLWTDFEGAYWLRRDGKMIALKVESEPFRRSEFHKELT